MECKEPLYLESALLAFGLLLATISIVFLFHRFGHLVNAEMVASFKITVSYVTIVSTISTQFAVHWPPLFLKALQIMSALTFDISVFSGVFCLAQLSFFSNLLITTIGLVVIELGFCVVSIIKPKSRDMCLKLAVYLLLFAYPGERQIAMCIDFLYIDSFLVMY